MRYTVRTWINEDFMSPKDYARRMARGMLADDYLTEGPVLEIEAPSERMAVSAAWIIGNRMDVDSTGEGWPSDVRSLSVGDVVQVGEEAWAFIGIGERLLKAEEFARATCTGILPKDRTLEELDDLRRLGFCPSCAKRHDPVRIETTPEREEFEAWLASVEAEDTQWESRA